MQSNEKVFYTDELLLAAEQALRVITTPQRDLLRALGEHAVSKGTALMEPILGRSVDVNNARVFGSMQVPSQIAARAEPFLVSSGKVHMLPALSYYHWSDAGVSVNTEVLNELVSRIGEETFGKPIRCVVARSGTRISCSFNDGEKLSWVQKAILEHVVLFAGLLSCDAGEGRQER